MADRVSPHFTVPEMACRCGCGALNINCNSLEALELFRVALDRPLIPSSACRCDAHNRHVNGSPVSWHLASARVGCRAFDLSSPGMTAGELMKALEAWDTCNIFTGRGLYPYDTPASIHIDTGHANLTRWIRTADRKYHTVGYFPEGLQ